MTTLHTLLLVAHVVVSAAIIGLVLLQKGKGAEAGAAFGAGASGTVFGAKGSANFLSRSTAVMATLFFVSSLALAYIGAQRPVSRSLVDEPVEVETGLVPVTPEESADVDVLPALPDLPEPEPVPEAPAP
ncbi:MAG: preprotein translocase subunit SecG [Chromatiales bacterium]|nr:MAG: preprotein translocase subunit SecG [Chromatiales bacterium]